ncbi:MAG: UDP-N-acetylglucosamine--LPS N-acetylglucosamine transferase [Phycisphaerae bacterium]|nr:UDP-N-acetylglucosamine--LPS N-acetylglucosamine transferase [Phycisphaerae bacterium]
MVTKKLKICLAASAGGHLSQLLALADSWKGHDTFCVCTSEVVRGRLARYGRSYIVGECNRQHPLQVLKVFLRCTAIAFRERPHVVISTGAAAGCMECFLCKLMGAKIVWMDSITNVDRLSLSGRMVRHIADLFLVQWPELTLKYQNVHFAGTVI